MSTASQLPTEGRILHSMPLSARFSQEFKNSAGAGFRATCCAIAIIGMDSDWTRDKASALKLDAVAASLGITRDEAAGRLMGGDVPAKRADGQARKMLSYATRICEPQVAQWSTVRAEALNGSPEKIEAALRALGIDSNWALEQALKKKASQSTRNPLQGILNALLKIEDELGSEALDNIINGINAFHAGEQISFDKGTTTIMRDMPRNDNVVGEQLSQASAG